MDILRTKSEKEFSNYDPYLHQPEVVYHVLFDAITKTENELNTKWNMNVALGDSDFSRVGGKLLDEIYDKYKKVDTLDEFVSPKTIDEIKRNTNKIIISDLEKYKTENHISDDKFLEIKKEAVEIFNKNLDGQIEKVLELDIEDNLKALYCDWNDAYRNLDYISMNDTAKKMDKLYNGEYLFKNEKLNQDVKYVLVKNEYINKKIETKNEGRLSEIEEEIFEQMKNRSMLY